MRWSPCPSLPRRDDEVTFLNVTTPRMLGRCGTSSQRETNRALATESQYTVRWNMADTDELLIPDAAKRDTKSFELLRIWIAEKGQHVSLRTGVWKDPAAWGVMLVDLACHIANAHQQTEGRDKAEVLERIRAGLDAEFSKRTDTPTGKTQP